MRNQHWLSLLGQTLSMLLILLSLAMGTAMAGVATEKRTRTHARVDWHQVGAPFGRFLLIRKGTSTCAVRFTEFHRGNNAKPPTLFSSGDESHHAEYDWYWQADGSGDFRKPNVQSGHAKLIQKPLLGIGSFAFQTGKVHVRCGPFKLLWHYPVAVSFDVRGECSDQRTELAPTALKNIGDITGNNPDTRWYKCDQTRKSLLIPLDEL
jgi:hypothetical protein